MTQRAALDHFTLAGEGQNAGVVSGDNSQSGLGNFSAIFRTNATLIGR